MILSLLIAGHFAFAQEPVVPLDPVQIIGGESQELNKPNSSHYISKEKLERHQDTDVNRVIKQVPGVYVREEDGFGLRPNIGLRGTNPDRSKKINFLEDGILAGPAPYSAPAAYYTPSMFHVENMEVFKGVATVPYGPNSVGGSINFITPEVPSEPKGFVEASSGSHDYRKFIGRAGTGGETYGILFQGAYHETSGFKELDGGGNTGFQQGDFILKGRVRTRGGDRPQFLDLKIGYAREDSDETYLGLTDADFKSNPYRRYAASQLDHMKWDHKSYSGSYTAALTQNSTVVLTLYRREFERTWYRFDRFANANLTARAVLEDPNTYQDYAGILRGEVDSSAIGAGNGDIDIARNHRTFFSQGAQALHMISEGSHDLRWGLRWHQDQIRRDHAMDRYSMTSGRLVRTADARVQTASDRDTSLSQSIFAVDEISLGPVRMTVAGRYERVETDDRTIRNSDNFFVPGVGAVWSVVPEFSIFTGVNRGYSPVGPGQNDAVKPEESTNYEAGVRYQKAFFAEIIGFFNDYQNIKGLCSFSSGCGSADLEFNGGKAHIYGAESRARFGWAKGKWKFPFELNYTYTKAEFQTAFTSTSEEWGLGAVRKGDPLPYVPENQYTLNAGLERGKWKTDVRFTWTGDQYDSAAAGRKTVDAYGVVDLDLKYYLAKESFAYLKVDNLLDNEYIVSYRPYGARPGKDRMFQVGLRYGW